jgi:fluoroquinolone transport system permease protein
VTLVAFATIEGVIVQVIGFWGVSFNVLALAAGIISLGLMNTLVGLGQVASHTSVLSFLMPGAALVGSVMQWPFLGALGIGPWWLYYAIPTNGPFLLMRGAFSPLEPWQWGYAVGMSLLTIAALARWARRRLHTHLRLQQT